MYATDQLKHALELDEESGKFELDENGYTRFIPSDKELTAINLWLSTEHDIAEDEYAPIYQEAAEDLETYKTSKTQDIIEGEPAILPAPIARIAVDQVVAWTFNTVMRPTPIVSIQPSFADTYQIVVPADPSDPELAAMGLTATVPVTVPIQAEDAVQRLEAGYDHKLTTTIQFSNVIRDAVLDACTVKRGYAKVCWEQSQRSVFRPKLKNGVFLDMSDVEEDYETDPDGVRWYSIPVFNILKRVHEDDLDSAEWLSERTPTSPETFRARCLTGTYPLIVEADIDAYSKLIGDQRPQQQQTADATLNNRFSTVPRNMLDTRLVWFYRWLKFKREVTDPTTGEVKTEKVVRRVSLYGDYHHGARKVCSIYRNYRNDQLRPYAVLYQLKDSHTDSGSSTTSISKWFQRVITYCFQSEIKNAFSANTFATWFDPDSRAASVVGKSGFRFRPGMSIPGKFDEEWGVVRAGEGINSMVGLIGVLRQLAREAQNMSVYESGDNVPSRTPSSTISQILQQGLQQPIFFLRNVSDFVSRLVRLDLETRRQFQPMGEVIPTQDAKTKETINIPFRFPTGDIARNLRISLTAADEAMAREHEPEQLMMLLNLWQQGSQFVAQVAGPLTNAEATPAQRELFVQVVRGWQSLFDRVIAMTRTDRDKFDLQSAVEALKQEAELAVQGMMNAAAANQVGTGPVGVNGGAAVPTGPEGLAGQPGNAPTDIPPPVQSPEEPTFVQ